MADKSGKPPKDTEAELWNAIAAFEKILEVFPNDRISLESLAGAYEKVGDYARSVEYAFRLTNVLIDESDEDAAREMLNKLAAAVPDDPRLDGLSKRLKTVTPHKVMADVIDEDDDMTRRSLGIAAEISFAWNLLQAGKLSQEEYSRVVHDLSENSARSSDTPVSTLHALRDMNFANMNAIMGFASSSCKTPFISLANFDIPPAAASLLNLSFVVGRGALPFALMGGDALIAILNPYDDQLAVDIKTLIDKTCHFFLAAPDDFDRALAKIREMASE